MLERKEKKKKREIDRFTYSSTLQRPNLRVHRHHVELDNRAELCSSVVARTLLLMARSFKFLAILRFLTFFSGKGDGTGGGGRTVLKRQTF